MIGKVFGKWLIAGLFAISALITPVLASADNNAPMLLLQKVSQDMIDSFKKEKEKIKTDPEHMFVLVEEILLPHIDIYNMSRGVLGRFWKEASTEQRNRFQVEFKTLMIRFYISALLEDPSKIDSVVDIKNLIEFMPPQAEANATKLQVQSKVNLSSGTVIPVAFSMRYSAKQEKWLAYDVTVDGISLIFNYRGVFGPEIQSVGLDKFLERLAKQNEDLLEKVRTGKGMKTASNQ
jgi:phospholipid transport system substrate-binding protein